MRATASAFFTFPLSCGDLGMRLCSPETHLYAANADRRHPRARFFTSSQREGCGCPVGPIEFDGFTRLSATSSAGNPASSSSRSEGPRRSLGRVGHSALRRSRLGPDRGWPSRSWPR
jgi:hypothetical protein